MIRNDKAVDLVTKIWEASDHGRPLPFVAALVVFPPVPMVLVATIRQDGMVCQSIAVPSRTFRAVIER